MDGPSSMRVQIFETLMVKFCVTPFSELTRMPLFTNSYSDVLLAQCLHLHCAERML